MEPNNANENQGGMANDFGAMPNPTPAAPAAPVAPAAPAMPVDPVNPGPTPAPSVAPNPLMAAEPINETNSSAPSDPVSVSVSFSESPVEPEPVSNPFENPNPTLTPAENPLKLEKKSNKTRLILIIIVVLMLLAGGIVAVVMMNGGKGNNTPPAVPTDDLNVDDENGEKEDPTGILKATADYDKIIEGINEKILNEGIEDSEAIIALYKEKLDAAEDEKVKAMLTLDYCQLIKNDEADENTKKEVLDTLVKADNILQTYVSAATVSKIATYYGDTAMADRYSKLSIERENN